MSWSYSAFGTPEKVRANLKESLAKYAPKEGSKPSQSFIEFTAAAEHIDGLIGEIFDNRPGSQPPLVEVDASGSGSAQGDDQLDRNLSVSVKRVHKQLLV